MNYNLTISEKGLTFIQDFKNKNFPNEEIVLIIAEMHIAGGLMIPEIKSKRFMSNEQKRAFDNLFPIGYKSYPFSVYVDHQAQIEDSLPEEFLIDLQITPKGKKELVFKNPRFE